MLYPQSGRQRSMKQMSQILGNELERLSPGRRGLEWTSAAFDGTFSVMPYFASTSDFCFELNLMIL